MRNLVLVIAYDGTEFQGWQTQPGHRTVQKTIESAIGELTGDSQIRLNASGRTDAGVHALGQVANFKTVADYSPEVFFKAVNARMPEDVVIHSCREADESFDANRDAKRKRYRYVINDGPAPDLFQRKYSYHVRKRLDDEAMNRASRCLLGRHDFHSFESNWPNRASSVRTVYDCTVVRDCDRIELEVEADGFLYNMVRSIAGTLIDVGRGYLPENAVAHILKAEDRREAGPTAPAQGLFLMRVSYE